MKTILMILISAAISNASPFVTEIPWIEACDGASIEITTDKSGILGVRATAVHFATITEWTIHYLDGTPRTAEFRDSERGRILVGEEAGSLSGTNLLKRMETFEWRDGRFSVPDKALEKELQGILSKVTK